MFVIFPSLFSPLPALPNPAPLVVSANSRLSGNLISLNGRSFPIPWTQWTETGQTRLGISDTGARQLFGMGFSSANNTKSQPINWFSLQNLTVKSIAPYRYLDVTDLVQQAGATFTVEGETLRITSPAPRVENLTIENYGAVQRLIIQLDRPTFWQVSQNKNEGIITIEGNADPALIARFQTVSTAATPRNLEEDDLGSGENNAKTRILSLENIGNATRLRLNLPTAYGLQITSVANPDRIVIDTRPDAMDEKRIIWRSGVIWNQKYIPLQQDWFPVTWLEIDPKNPEITLRPITANPNSAKGTSPLVTIATANSAAGMINGGFFNRENRLPLGAIRVGGKWLSGPILDRGAIAWDERGNFAIGRLRLQETLITPDGKSYPLTHLNSGFVQAGISRYTREWGSEYTPLTNGETVLVIEGDRVTGRYPNAMTTDNFPIPQTGYLVIARKSDLPLAIDSPIRLDSGTNPSVFARYPHIIGAGPLLLENGRIVLDGELEKFSKAFQEQRASRSAIALTRDGKILLVALHNRIGGRGATLAEFARVLQTMGAVSALNLDGGSSTAIALGGQTIDRYPVTAANVHNGIGIFVSPSP
jgi:Phosphodiester glycosidase